MSHLHEANKWKIKSTIQKFDTQESLESGIPDEVQIVNGNALTNQGINLIWNILCKGGEKTTPNVISAVFSHENSFIGIGNAEKNDGSGQVTQAFARDAGLGETDASGNFIPSSHYIYMKMDTDYPKFPETPSTDPENTTNLNSFTTQAALSQPFTVNGTQKITFKSRFNPGVASFDWKEWTIANGNNNKPWGGSDASNKTANDHVWNDIDLWGTGYDGDVVNRTAATSSSDADYGKESNFFTENDTDGNRPATLPFDGMLDGRSDTDMKSLLTTIGDGKDVSVHQDGYPYPGTTWHQTNAINLNHKIESMGKKYPPATWIVAVEVSLS